MISVLIDTCSWVNLLKEEKAFFLVDSLAFWVNNERIKLFTHSIILEEWTKHKEKQRKAYKDSIEAKYRHAKEVIETEQLYVPKALEANTTVVDNLISKIDVLLAGAIVLETSLAVKAMASDRAIARIAPFHNKLDSTKDAYIIFSALEYFSGLNQPLTFISDNKAEFGDVSDLERKFHTDLLHDYPAIQVDYYREVGWAISDLRKTLDISLTPDSFSNSPKKLTVDKISIDKRKPLLEQLLQYLEVMHKDIKSIPPRILINHYPFRIGNENSVYYSLFNAEIANENLIQELEKIVDSETGELRSDIVASFPDVTNIADKSKRILKYLTTDLIFSISNRRGNLSIQTRYKEEESCDCMICNFKRLDFIRSITGLTKTVNDVEQLMLLGYTNYKFGNFIRSANCFSSAKATADANMFSTTSFISQYNLTKLGIFLLNHYYKNEDAKQHAKKYTDLELNDLIGKYGRPENREVLESLAENKFYLKAKEKILELHYKILDEYYSSLKGGWSSNSHVWAIKNYLVEMVTFLESNRIVYDKFSDFGLLCDRVFEAMIASHAIRGSSGSRLPSFDDWTLQQMILYGDPEKLNKFYARYGFKEFEYVDTGETVDGFIVMIENFFCRPLELRRLFQDHCEIDNRNFWNYYNKIFGNVFTLMSVSSLTSNQHASLANLIVDYLQEEDFIQKESIKYIRYYIIRVGQSLTTETLNRLFWVMVGNSKYHDEGGIESICEQLTKRKEQLSLTQAEFNALKSAFISKNEQGENLKFHPTLAVIYGCIKNELFQAELQSAVKTILLHEFDFGTYYRAVLFDILQYNHDELPKLLDHITPQPGRPSLKHFFGQPADRYDRIDDFLNLIFKLDLDTRAKEFDVIRKISPYYSWLLDMENFDYAKFDPFWVGEYSTRHYLRKIGSSERTKEALEFHLKQTSDTALEKLYYKMFVRRGWDQTE